ncbi:hypothetical protein GCM10029964_025710 [Kibdelosporangium lantanae]
MTDPNTPTSPTPTATPPTSRANVPTAGLTITDIVVTPIAFRDPPLLNSAGVHEPWALRTIVEIRTDSGIFGFGETYGDIAHVERLRAVAPTLIGLDAFAIGPMHQRVAEALRGQTGDDRHGLTGKISAPGTIDRVYSPFEVACLDIQGKAVGRPVVDLLGGAVRDAVPYSAYLFYKWAGHPGDEPDQWGEAIDPAGVVAEARTLINQYGFGSIKLKGGVFPPEQEIEAIRALRDAFPNIPLRLDPNAAWTPESSLKVAEALNGVLEYLEDPAPEIAGMAEVAAKAPMPLATNMCGVVRTHRASRRGQRRAGHPVRPPLLGWAAQVIPPGVDLRHLRHRPVDALQLAPGHQPGSHDPPGRGHTQPQLRLRHPLPVERGGRPRGARRAYVRRRIDSRADRARPRHRDRP